VKTAPVIDSFTGRACLALLTVFFMDCLPDLPAQAARKQTPARKAPAASAGAPYPQCRMAGTKIVHWLAQEMPLRVYIAHGTCLDDAGIDPAYGGPLSNTDNTAGWPDLVYKLVKSPEGLNNLRVAEGYTEQMWQAAAQGINQWKRFEKEGLYSFELTEDPQEANVFFFWTNHFVGKNGMALFANDIRGYTAKHLLPYAQVAGALNAGNTDLIERSLRPVVVQLRTTDSGGINRIAMPLEKMVPAAAHEMGHVLGIDGHSTNSQDLMSVYYGHGQISANDAATIRYIYRLAPDYLP
jgi:predicted Zn-dependent protease